MKTTLLGLLLLSLAQADTAFASPQALQSADTESGPGAALPPDEVIEIGAQRTLFSKRLDEQRTLLIHTPTGYETSGESYPVLFLLDGPNHFTHTVGATEFLARSERMPGVIVVGIANTNRARDLTPSRPADMEQGTAGGASEFLGFLTEELGPWLDEQYRTRPVRLLIGHSFGGLFAVHSLVEGPGYFDGLIAISPSMHWDEQRLVGQAKQWIESIPTRSTSLYLTVGNEGAELLGGTLKLTAMLTESPPKNIRWSFRHMPQESHGSVPFRSTYDGLEFLFQDWSLAEPLTAYDSGGLLGMEARVARARTRFGYEANVSMDSLIELLFALDRDGRRQEALDLTRSLDRRKYLLPPFWWRFAAGACERAGDLELARKNYLQWQRLYPTDLGPVRGLEALGAKAPNALTAADLTADYLQSQEGELLGSDGTGAKLRVIDGQLTMDVFHHGPVPMLAMAPIASGNGQRFVLPGLGWVTLGQAVLGEGAPITLDLGSEQLTFFRVTEVVAD